MKMIIAIIKPERFEFVKKALEDKGYISMTITEVKGRGAQKGITLEYRGGKMIVDLLPKVKLEIVIHDKDVDDLIATLTGAARTGKIGDGKIFVVPVRNPYGSGPVIWSLKKGEYVPKYHPAVRAHTRLTVAQKNRQYYMASTALRIPSSEWHLDGI